MLQVFVVHRLLARVQGNRRGVNCVTERYTKRAQGRFDASIKTVRQPSTNQIYVTVKHVYNLMFFLM